MIKERTGERLCPECDHAVAGHRYHDDDTGLRFGSKHYCDERRSLDNNDFCGCTHGAPAEKSVVFYVIKNHEGKYRSSHWSEWSYELEKAKIYSKASSAQCRVTAWANQNPSKPIPVIVEMYVTVMKVVDQNARVAKSRFEKQNKAALRDAWVKERTLKNAEEEFKRAQEKLERLRSGT